MLRDLFADRLAEAPLEHELKQNVSGMGVDALLARLFAVWWREGIKRVVEPLQ